MRNVQPVSGTEPGPAGRLQTSLSRQRGQNRALWDVCVISCFLPKVTTLLTDTSVRLLHLLMKNFPSQTVLIHLQIIVIRNKYKF